MFAYDWQLSLIAVGLIGVIALISLLVASLLRKKSPKSMLAKLQLGLFQPADGQIVLYGKNIARHLPNGPRQRVAIARAFLRRQSILIVDEAVLNLDKLTVENFAQTIS